MNSQEFLTEASIFSKPKQYSYGHKVRVKTTKDVLPFLKKIQAVIPDFDPSEDLEWIEKIPQRAPRILVGRADQRLGGGNERYFKRPNGQRFALVGSDSTIEASLLHAPGQKGSTAENVGDSSEPVLSAAVVAKLIKRGSNRVEDVTGEDVKYVLARALKNPDLNYEVNDKNSRVADSIKFTLRVKDPILGFLKSPAFWDKYDPLLPSVVHYANSGQLDRYADYFYKNGKVDQIHVKSDGVSDATERKTDVEATVNGKPLKNLNISLKAGSPHIGQVGGGLIDDPFKEPSISKKTGKPVGPIGIWVAANKLFGPFGVEIPRPTKKVQNRVSFWEKAYKIAAKQIKAELAGVDARAEAGVIARLANYVVGHATGDDPNVRLVSLGVKGVSTVHSFKNLQQKLIANHINLDCDYRAGMNKAGTEVRPEIRIYDKTSGKPVMYMRYSSTETGDKVWNTIEMRDLLKDLTTLTYQKAQPQPTMAQPVQPTAPVSKKVAPVAPPEQPELEPEIDTEPEISAPLVKPRARRTATQPVRPRR